MADTIKAGSEQVVLTAVYTMSDGTTRPADDATWAVDDPLSAAVVDTTSGAVVNVTGNDHGDGSTDAVSLTVAGSGFTASAEVDIAASSPTLVGISISSSGAEPA